MNDQQRHAKLQQAEKLLKQTRDGYPGPNKGTFWRPALELIDEVEADLKPVVRRLVFPIAGPDSNVFVGGLHETSGLSGNWALDFICKAGLGIVAPEAGIITRFSGHDPADDEADRTGVYGWTTYLETPAGYTYFITHQGRRYPTLRVGQHVQPGDLLGFVGDQRFRPDHAHIGVTSPKGEADAKARITAVSKAPKVT
jgi:murein DD-endopeptidase MepM/ murein hydrolase activator NlpD